MVNSTGFCQPEMGRGSKVRIGEESTLASPLLVKAWTKKPDRFKKTCQVRQWLLDQDSNLEPSG